MEVTPRSRYSWNVWSVLAAGILLLVATPILTLVVQLFSPPGESWPHLAANLLPGYVYNTLLLLLGVGSLTFILGLSSAWIVSTYHFPGRRYFEWLLILPLSFPGYIMAYTYTGMLGYAGTAHRFLREQLGISVQGSLLDLMNLPGAILILSLSLYPYVYLLARTSFMQQSRGWQEAAALLGKGSGARFFRVALPMARPAIAGGLALACMEVLNDYGTVKYLGVPTFTTGIFRAWFSLGDARTAIYLAAMLMVFVLLLLYWEKRQRGEKRYAAPRSSGAAPLRSSPGRLAQWGLTTVLSVLFLVSFGLPLLQLIQWSWLSYSKVVSVQFFQLTLRSFLLAAGAGLLVVCCATLLQYALRLSPFRWMQHLVKVATLGYAIPGAVIAVGIMIPLLSLDKWIIANFSSQAGLLFSGTLVALVFAYVVRFMAVGYNPVEAGFQRLGIQIHEASRMLGAGTGRTLWRIELPLLRSSMVAGVLLVFVDVLKELPLTLILRPFNFHTLATKAFDMATNEMVVESSNAALVIILTGILPILLLNRILRRTHKL